MAIDYTALKSELQIDPRTYGYAPLISAGNDTGLADLLNKVRDGTDGFAVITVRRPDISATEILEAIDTRDFITAPTTLQAGWFESATQQPRGLRLLNTDGTDTRVLGNLKRLVNNTQNSQSRLNSIANRNGSRAEELFGTNTHVTDSDIAIALRNTP